MIWSRVYSEVVSFMSGEMRTAILNQRDIRFAENPQTSQVFGQSCRFLKKLA